MIVTLPGRPLKSEQHRYWGEVRNGELKCVGVTTDLAWWEGLPLRTNPEQPLT